MYWPGMDNDITNKCRSCPKCKFNRPSNIKESLQHLPVAEYPFQIISAGWFDLNGNKFLVIVDWYSGYFDVNGPFINPDAAAVISSFREWFINTAVCDVFWSDGGPSFGSSDVNNFLKRWGAQWSRRPHVTLKVTLWLNQLSSGQKVFFENVGVAEDSL